MVPPLSRVAASSISEAANSGGSSVAGFEIEAEPCRSDNTDHLGCPSRRRLHTERDLRIRRVVHTRRIFVQPDIVGGSPRSDNSGRECRYRIRFHNTEPEGQGLCQPAGLSRGEPQLLPLR